jgi:hypothetical protein
MHSASRRHVGLLRATPLPDEGAYTGLRHAVATFLVSSLSELTALPAARHGRSVAPSLEIVSDLARGHQKLDEHRYGLVHVQRLCVEH